VLEHLLRAAIRPFEQQLTGKSRPIQLPRRQPIDHPDIVPRGYDAGGGSVSI
jgi:hypothetical protein